MGGWVGGWVGRRRRLRQSELARTLYTSMDLASVPCRLQVSLSAHACGLDRRKLLQTLHKYRPDLRASNQNSRVEAPARTGRAWPFAAQSRPCATHRAFHRGCACSHTPVALPPRVERPARARGRKTATQSKVRPPEGSASCAAAGALVLQPGLLSWVVVLTLVIRHTAPRTFSASATSAYFGA